jgi:hypothetical protein
VIDIYYNAIVFKPYFDSEDQKDRLEETVLSDNIYYGADSLESRLERLKSHAKARKAAV